MNLNTAGELKSVISNVHASFTAILVVILTSYGDNVLFHLLNEIKLK